MERQKQVYFNFENSLNSPYTKKQYIYCLEQFMGYCKLDLYQFLKLSDQKMTDLIIQYLVQKKVSKSNKNTIFFAIKHSCEVNDRLLNWKKIQKFVKSERTEHY